MIYIDDSLLFDIYSSVRRNTLWYSKLMDAKVLNREHLNKIVEYDTPSKDDIEFYHNHSKNVKRIVFDFIEEINKEDGDFVDDCRMRYLLQSRDNIQSIIFDILKKYSDQVNDGTTNDEREFQFKLANIEQYKLRLKRIENEIRFMNDKKEYEKNKLTPLEIERAEQYPIDMIVNVDKRGFAFCVNHSDRNPSMYCKNGFVYCYSCGFTANAIQLYRKVHNCGFVEAVKFLSNRGI